MAGLHKKRLKILVDQEIEELYGLPRFNHEERELFFDLTPEERAVADSHHNLPRRVLFILQLGYFKAKTLFFDFEFNDVHEDVRHVLRVHYRQIAVDHNPRTDPGVNLEAGKSVITKAVEAILPADAPALIKQQTPARIQASASQKLTGGQSYASADEPVSPTQNYYLTWKGNNKWKQELLNKPKSK